MSKLGSYIGVNIVQSCRIIFDPFIIHQMIQARISPEKQYHRKTIIDTLKNTYEKLGTPNLYLESRAHKILTVFLELSQIIGTGFTSIMTHGNVPEKDIESIVLVAVLGEHAITQIERYWHLFSNIYIINLTISGEETKELIRVSPLRKKLTGFIQISLNFMPFIDSVYYSNIVNNQAQQQNQAIFEDSLISFLLSFQKYYQFEISLLESSYAKQLGESIQSRLQKHLKIMQTYKCKEYKSQSSPRIKVLILQRKIDQMSPLLYSYHFGPVAKEIQAFDKKNIQFTINSPLFNALFPLDVEEANDFLTALAQDKAQNQKMKFELHDFERAKQVITKHYDQHSSPEQIELQIDVLSSVKKFCKRRAVTTALQQTIVNAISEGGEKMSGGKVVDRIVEWASVPLEDLKPSQQDYIKILILSYMVNSFWFWNRRIINAGIDETHKERVVKFCKKVEGKFNPLTQKVQGEDRYDLYRHQPKIVEVVGNWAANSQGSKYFKIEINKSSVNRESKMVVAVKGPLGYGQLALLIKQLKKLDKSSEYIIFCQSLMTTKQYLKLLLEQKK